MPYAVWLQDQKNQDVEDVVILSGDHLYRMDYIDFVQVSWIERGHCSLSSM